MELLLEAGKCCVGINWAHFDNPFQKLGEVLTVDDSTLFLLNAIYFEVYYYVTTAVIGTKNS